jgi:hypothetical protein
MLEEDADFWEADVYISPPDNGNATDEDSADEEGGTVNNLSGKQLDAVAIATAKVNGERVLVGEDIESQLDSDTEPEISTNVLVNLSAESSKFADSNKRKYKAVNNKPSKKVATTSQLDKRTDITKLSSTDEDDILTKPRIWKKKDFAAGGESSEWNGKMPKFLQEDWSPLGLFQLLFDNDITQMICDYTMIYAHQKGAHAFNVNPDDINTFIGILLSSGYVVMPRRKMYWEQTEDVKIDGISTAMSRNRFEEILQYVHLSDNTKLAPGDKFAKLRPLIVKLNEQFLLYNPVEKHLSIDESMVPYFGRHSCKQFIRGKPIRFGYKLWCMNTNTGYLLQFEPYQGANTTPTKPGLGMGGSVVVDLLSELDLSVKYHVYFDNLFTSLKLMDFLNRKGVGSTGTIRANRVEKCTVTDMKQFSKSPRGSYDYRMDTANNVEVVRWHDNSVVTIASNCLGTKPVVKAKRWSAAEKKVIDVDQPYVIQAYNAGMGGVDRMDQNVSKYRISIRSKKWWWPVFAHLLDVTVQNAWLLYRKCPSSADRPMCLLEFRREICQVRFWQID